MASPARSRSHSPDPHWTRPCGAESSAPEPNDYDLIYAGAPASESDLLRDIRVQAEISLGHAESFREEYVSKTFNVDFDTHHRDWNGMRLFKWLPNETNLPKDLGQKVSHEHLHKISQSAAEYAYKNMYVFLQQVGVGMEQVEQDQVSRPFHDEFRKCNVELNKILCELQSLMIFKGLAIPENQSRDIMSDELRRTVRDRNFRDWLIFREYMNVLEYVSQVLSFMQDRLPS